MNKVAVYPGTFDPITLGHADIIKRALFIFDKVVVAVASSINKKPYYDLEKRKSLIQESLGMFDESLQQRIEVVSFDSLLVDLCKAHKAHTIVRGVRSVSDFEYEIQLNYANNALDETIETIFLMPSLEFSYISSSIVRSILGHDGDVSHLVPPPVLDHL